MLSTDENDFDISKLGDEDRFWAELETPLSAPDVIPDLDSIVPPSRAGFAALKKRNPDLYRRWKNHINSVFDRYDWAYLYGNGAHGCKSKPRTNKKETLNLWFTKGLPESVLRDRDKYHPRPQKLSLKTLEDHCSNISTIYYTSTPFGGKALLLIDVDDKDGSAGDSKAVFDYVSILFPRIFGQTSTFGKGYHGFLGVYYDMPVKSFRELCSKFEDSLSSMVLAAGFKSTVEVKGIPGLKSKDGSYEVMGQAAKFPRLVDDSAISEYLACPVYPVAALQSIVKQAALPKTNLCSPPSVTLVHTDAKNPIIDSILHVCTSVTEGRTGGGPTRRSKRATSSQSPAQRLNFCSIELSNRLHRAATASEILEEYEAQGLNTGTDDDGQRAKLAESQALWLQNNYDPSKARRFELEDYILQIQKHVTPEVRGTIYSKNRSSYSDEELAVVLYTVARASIKTKKDNYLPCGVPLNRLAKMFKALDRTLTGSEGAIRNKLAAIKQALEAAQLIVSLDGGFYTRQLGKRYSLGPNYRAEKD
jgi:hypothetical protein